MKSEVKNNLIYALNSCAKTCTLTRNVDDALKMSESCEKLSKALLNIYVLESEEK